MHVEIWMLFVLALSLTDNCDCIIPEDTTTLDDDDVPTRQNDKFSSNAYPYIRGGNDKLNNYNEDERLTTDYNNNNNNRRCSDRLEYALEQIRRRKLMKQKTLHLDGYSLHQQLRSAPYDMYVTNMRVRLSQSNNKWVRVDRCSYNPLNTSLETRLLFNDITISGRVNLFNEGELEREPLQTNPEDRCNMILRIRRAGIGFHTEPIRRERGQFNVKTDSHFIEPGFISVYAYGCEPRLKERHRELNLDDDEDLSREMENIFLKGIRSLLTTYMQKELQPAIKETLMTNMGYTISYG